MIQIKRIYEKPNKTDGKRILVDRLWPRGFSKKKARLTLWLKDIAPSNDLRQWFNHDLDKWKEFKKRYLKEIKASREALSELKDLLGKGKVTLVYSARSEEYNNAAVLKEYLERK